jgi:hypothetical protein
MKSDLRSKFIDGLLSTVIIMVMMWPLILLFRVLNAWGTVSYWVAVVLLFSLSTWTLYRATLEKLSEVGRVWYGIFGGLAAWTVAELSHELGMLDIEQPGILIVLVLSIASLAVLWKYFPGGVKFWIIVFMLNWSGHVYIHVVQEFLADSAVKTIFTITAVAHGLLGIGLVYWIFARTTSRIQRLWAGLWIWWSLAMVYFLMR